MKSNLVACLLMALSMGGCASSVQSSAPLVVDRVGPSNSAALCAQSGGTLLVFSAWAESLVGTDHETQHHRDYRVLRSDGSLLQNVRNSMFALFGDPTPVTLSPGDYVVDTVDPVVGHVQVPVHIATGRTTRVCLTGEFDDRYEKATNSPETFVTLKDGRVVGWKSGE